MAVASTKLFSRQRVPSGGYNARLKEAWRQALAGMRIGVEQRTSGGDGDQDRRGRRDVRSLAGRRGSDGSIDLLSPLELESGGDRGVPPGRPNFDGMFQLLVINLALFVAQQFLKLPVTNLYLNLAQPHWWQFVTSTFCHSHWGHLSGNLFFLYVFGKLVEEEEGPFGVWASYITTGVCANIVSYFLLPHTQYGVPVVCCGASGAVFGLFAISVLVKLSFNFRKLLEVMILGQFVVERVMSELQMQTQVLGHGVVSGSVNHVAHLAGALAGVMLIYLLTRVPSLPEEQRRKEASSLTSHDQDRQET